MRTLNNTIIRQSHNNLFYDGQISSGAEELTKQVAESIKADRCSIWLYNSDKTSIICQKLYISSEKDWYSGVELFEEDFEPYFKSLKESPIIIADDAETNSSTSCFTESYLKPLGIKSMLDVPILHRGSVIGVICIESLTRRKWHDIEVDFAQMLSSLYSFAYSVKEENKQRLKLKEMDDFINQSALVSKADDKGRITYVNQKFIDLSGWSLEEALGKDHRIVNSKIHPRHTWTEMYKQVIKEKKIWNMVVTNQSKDGNLYYVDTHIKAEFDPETNKLTGFTSIRQDVTDIKVKEQEIQNQLSAINKSNMVIEFDLDGNILYANDRFLETMGFDYIKNGGLDEIVGINHVNFVDKDYSKSSEYKDFWKSLRAGNFISGEFPRLSKDKKIVWLRATYNPIVDLNGKVYKIMKLAVDITETVKDKEEISKKNSYLEHAAKILRHDMHSGINTYIPRGLSSLERRLTEEQIKDLKIEAPLKMIKEGLKHSQKVFKGVYEFTNLVKKDVVLNKSMCNLSTILKDYLSSTAYSSQVIVEDLGECEVNEALFCTALDNLIRNGLKYNDSDSKFVKLYRKKNIIYIEDNGRGMTSEEFDILKEPYTRREGQKESGSGLGLNICIAILSEHGFSVTCDKMKKGGTQLKIKLKK